VPPPAEVNDAASTVFMEVSAFCDLHKEDEVLRCGHPLSLFVGDEPLLSSKLYQIRNGVETYDRSDL
jgi:hypothetical protein